MKEFEFSAKSLIRSCPVYSLGIWWKKKNKELFFFAWFCFLGYFRFKFFKKLSANREPACQKNWRFILHTLYLFCDLQNLFDKSLQIFSSSQRLFFSNLLFGPDHHQNFALIGYFIRLTPILWDILDRIMWTLIPLKNYSPSVWKLKLPLHITSHKKP